MTNEFRAMLDRFVLVYLNDILVYSRTLEDHLGHLRRVLETPRRAKYKANRDKCEFVRQELEYLGHFVTREGISPLLDKIQAIQEWPEPRNVTDVCSFFGLAAYYQRFIKGYSKIAAHLTKLQCEDRPFDFGEEARESFLALKTALLSAEVLRIYDPLLPTRVTTDAFGYGIGAVLEQHDRVDWHPVEYFSKEVPIVHSIDDARKKELLAFVHPLKRWRHFLLGRSQFRWVTENNPLVFYKTQDTVNSTIARWMTFIDQFDFFPYHIPGKLNRFADALSRRPNHCPAVYSTFEVDDNLRNSFIRGYQADSEFCDKYDNCSSPNPAPSHYRIEEGQQSPLTPEDYEILQAEALHNELQQQLRDATERRQRAILRKARLGTWRLELGKFEALDESALDPAMQALSRSLLCVAETQVVQQEVLAELVVDQNRILAALQAPRPMMRQPRYFVAPPSVAGPTVTPWSLGPSFSPMFGISPSCGLAKVSGPVLGTSPVPSMTVAATVPSSGQAQCEPNCHAKILEVDGQNRIILVARKDISSGEELTYDYRFDEEDQNKVPCRCGARNCRQFMN
ncbi:hypothetical protein CBR_g18924 [Chara braunii]|uniref:Post-SET domain-containing protein n=1 Tax=Chara braunii TaxID=69332 RepID=A0A388KWS7_CHABU|nr:hypothetical protein CBR_g18924 [Chara braunii]|eukprot:GBG74514.1 hypothetical protein CBR_g18924 [Chara braunii]